MKYGVVIEEGKRVLAHMFLIYPAVSQWRKLATRS
jgi:hypothetical protein